MIKSLYLLANSLLPKLKLSHKNVQYYASIVDYYTIHDLRKRLKTEQSYVYLLCYIWKRYLQLNDNWIDAFDCNLGQFETDLKKETEDAFSAYAVSKQSELVTMKKMAK